jgi:hypothetical protein
MMRWGMPPPPRMPPGYNDDDDPHASLKAVGQRLTGGCFLKLREIAWRVFIQCFVALAICGALATTDGWGYWALVFPIILGIPGIIVTVAMFVPIEVVGIRWSARWASLIFIPFVGAAAPWLDFPLHGDLNNFIEAARQETTFGFIWGLLWGLTRIVYAAFLMKSPMKDDDHVTRH